MLKIIFLIANFLLFKSFLFANNFAYIILNAENGQVMCSHRADELRPPASLTKIMTCYLIFEAIKNGKITLNTKFRVSKRATQQEPTNLWLKEGETISVKNIIMSLITRSANDMSVTVAEGLAGSVENFAKLMNEKAESLGMENTVFYNPTGLPHKKQVTTARDMAILSRAIQKKFPEEYKLFKTKVFYYNGKPIHNHNRMLKSFPGMDGIKTGFTFASRFNIATSAVRKTKNGNNVRLFAVVLGGQTSVSRDKKTAELLEKAFCKLNSAKHVFVSEKSKKNQDNTIEDLIDSVEKTELKPTKKSKPKKHKQQIHNDYVDIILQNTNSNNKNIGVTLPTGWVKGTIN